MKDFTNSWLAGNDDSWRDIVSPRPIIISLKVVKNAYIISANPNLWKGELVDADIEQVATRNDIIAVPVLVSKGLLTPNFFLKP